MKVICNTSPIIGLLSIDRMDLLWELFDEVIIPKAVERELCVNDQVHKSEVEAIRHYISTGKLQVYTVQNEELVKKLYGKLHFGELEVIIGAKECGIAVAIIDEISARKMAEDFLVDTIGILGILSLAKRKGLLKSVKEDVDLLRSKGYRISDKLYMQFLKQNQE